MPPSVRLIPVDHDPFDEEAPQPFAVPVDYDPWGAAAPLHLSKQEQETAKRAFKAVAAPIDAIVGAPSRAMAANPYPPGSEEWEYYEQSRSNNISKAGADTALAMLGGGTTFAERGALGALGGRFVQNEGGPLGAPNVVRPAPIFDQAGMPIRGKAFSNAAEEAQQAVAASPKGYGPLDLSLAGKIPDVPQVELPRYVPPRGTSPRMQDALGNNNMINGVAESIDRGLELGADKWYHTEPIRSAWEKELGDAHADPFKLHMDLQAAASPRSDVPTQIRNGSWMYMHAMQGQPLPPKGPEIYPYGHLAANLHRQNFETVTGPGWDVFKNPKPPSFSANLQGNLVPGTMDTHAFRNIGMRTGDPRFLATQIQEVIPAGREVGPNSAAAKFGEISQREDGTRIATYRPQKLFEAGKLPMDEALKIPAFWHAQPNPNEYAAAENLYRIIGDAKGLPTADAQAAAWAGGGHLTGLGTAPDRTFPELMNERIMYTAHLRGVSPEQVLRDLIRGQKPLLGIAGIAGTGAGIWEHESHAPIERNPYLGVED